MYDTSAAKGRRIASSTPLKLTNSFKALGVYFVIAYFLPSNLIRDLFPKLFVMAYFLWLYSIPSYRNEICKYVIDELACKSNRYLRKSFGVISKGGL